MAYVDAYVSRDDRYSIGFEDTSRRYYVSIPVSSGTVDYEEHYELIHAQYRQFLDDPSAAVEFVESCRRHERDELLIEKPGWIRGTPG